jgi:hypothetical protein
MPPSIWVLSDFRPSHWDDSDALKDSPRKVGLGDTPDEDILKDMDSNSVSAMDIHTENI